MPKMTIIGHRGARGLAPENTLAGIRRALAEGVDGVEFDIHLTADGHLVLLHDYTLARTCGIDKNVGDLTIDEIKKMRTLEGEPVPTAQEALAAIDAGKAIVIEGKGKGWAEPLAKLLKNHPKKDNCTVISFNHPELAKFKSLSPAQPTYGLHNTSAAKAISSAQKHGFSGVDINYRLLNPLSYLWARLHGLEVIVYTLNRPLIARYFSIFCPRAAITTDYPDRLQRFRR